MTITPIKAVPTTLPDHTQLPESDGTFVFAQRAGGKNFQEHPQSILLTDSIQPVLQKLYPEGNYCIGQDSGIYWRMTDPPEKGAEAPDWFYVPNVPASLDGQMRRSYVLWQEIIPPFIVLEFVSGNGTEERDKTPWKGKFWIYEKVIRPAFYGIYEVMHSRVEVYHLIEDHYELITKNERGNYPIHSLGVELGIWLGHYQNVELPWLRWWDGQGNLLLTGEERAEIEKQEKEQERALKEQAQQQLQETELLLEEERQRAERLAQKLRAMNINPDV